LVLVHVHMVIFVLRVDVARRHSDEQVQPSFWF
jgi:hypothetical protein